MVVGNVVKLHARKLHARNLHVLAGILAASVVVPTGCSGGDFEGCEASRTCPVKGGESGEGSGGESGGGNDTGGRAGNSSGGNAGTSSGGSSAGSGSDDGGEAGTGGTGGSDGEDTEEPTIVSITPGDGDVDVERDVTVTIEFSEAIDEDSVTATSVVLTGPDGDVAGTLGVDGNVVEFTPEKKLYLLGDYELTIDETIADLAGNALERGEMAGFKVRDGRWGEPMYPFGETERRVMTQLESNTSGDVIVGTEIWPDRQNVIAGIYHAEDGQWITRELPGAASAVGGLGIDLERRAAIGLNDGGWFVLGGSGSWTRIESLPSSPYIEVTSGGLAVATYWEPSLPSYVSRVHDLGSATTGSVQQIPRDVTSTLQIVSSLDRVAILSVRPVSSGEELAVLWKESSGWTTPEPLASAASLGYFNADSDEQGN
jgi:hypothetical protein